MCVRDFLSEEIRWEMWNEKKDIENIRIHSYLIDLSQHCCKE